MLPVVLSANGQAAGYRIANSLRFRSSASAYLSRTPASAGNQTTWTWSGWVKRGSLGGADQIIMMAGSGTADQCSIRFYNDTLTLYFYTATMSNYFVTTSAVFRDPSSWYHFVVSVDTSQATASNRVVLYVNGATQTLATANYPTQNSSLPLNSAVAHYIGKRSYASDGYFDGYMAEVNFIDGQALDPSYFGQVSPITGVWSPAPYVGSYGTNGFYLKFSDTTSTTTLCYDYSGNSNNWTPNNISLTAGSTYDSMLDSPTNYDNGGNGVGNYAVLNPVGTIGGPTISNGNLTIQASGNSYQTSQVSICTPTSGKWYYEFKLDTHAGSNQNQQFSIGDVLSSQSLTNIFTIYSVYTNLNYWYGTGVTTPTDLGIAANTGDVVQFAYDAGTGKFWAGVNGTWFLSGNPASGTNPIYTFGSIIQRGIFATNYGATAVSSFNAGQRPFAYTPPTGYKALNTQNLPTPSIVNGASYMAATTYTGTGASLSVSGAAFQPDLVWIKSRSAATDHALYDVIRGVQDRLESNTTDAEVTSDNGLTAFNSNGFTVNTLAQVNTNAATYIGWQWKAGGTAVTNTAGSITSSVSANTTSGFAVVTYTGTGSNATVGHGLGVAPAFIIQKVRNGAGYYWNVWHSAFNGSQAIFLNATDAVTTNSAKWNGTVPSSTVFSVGTDTGTNGSGNTNVSYCFAAIPGYSAFGSYTGNGSADGPFVYCGFRPRYVLIKNSSATANWLILDTARLGYNGGNNYLYPSLSNAEDSGTTEFDILSNGFKPRYGASAAFNSNGATYIYAAFAESPFSLSLAR